MANARHKNTIYVDATGDITVDAVKPILYGILVTPSTPTLKVDATKFIQGPAGTYAPMEYSPVQISTVTIKESSSSGTIKVHVILERPVTQFFDFSRGENGGIELTTTFNITTLTNIANVILIGSWFAPIGEARG